MTRPTNLGIFQSMQGKNKAVFFDRDGTLIINKPYLNDPAGIEYFEDTFIALQRLRDHGFLFFVATNQSGIPRGWVDEKILLEMHQLMEKRFNDEGIKFEKYLYAPHMPETDHFDRKPNPGMIVSAAKEFNVDIGQSWMLGDRMTDVEAGHRAGCRTILLGRSEAEEPAKFDYDPPTAHLMNLLEASHFIMENS